MSSEAGQHLFCMSPKCLEWEHIDIYHLGHTWPLRLAIIFLLL